MIGAFLAPITTSLAILNDQSVLLVNTCPAE